jgi:hypothetical protein
MKTMLLASALALMASSGAAFASITTYTDGSTYNSATGVTTPAPQKFALGSSHTATDAPFSWFHGNDPKVVRWGPPDGNQSAQ